MQLQEFLDQMDRQESVTAGTEAHQYMTKLAHDAMQITAILNQSYHTPEQIRALMSQLTGRPIPDSFSMFPPFYTDCGKNTIIGEGVFINSGCRFQDQGGVTIGDGALLGHNVVLATLNHGKAPSRRHDLFPVKIHDQFTFFQALSVGNMDVKIFSLKIYSINSHMDQNTISCCRSEPHCMFRIHHHF